MEVRPVAGRQLGHVTGPTDDVESHEFLRRPERIGQKSNLRAILAAMVEQKPPGQGDPKDNPPPAGQDVDRVGAHLRSMLAKLKTHVATMKAGGRREG